MGRNNLPPSIRRSVNKQAENVLRTGSRFTNFNQIRQRHFWSSHFFTPDANGYIPAGDFPVFVTPTGSNGQGFPAGSVLTERETNWKSQNRVPDNQNFEITEIGVSIGIVTPDMDPNNVVGFETAPVDIGIYDLTFVQFISNTLINITYLTNAVPLGLVADFGQASAPTIGTYVSESEDTTALFRSNGFPAPALRRRFKIPILLQHGETFAFAFNIPRSFFVGSVEENVFVARLDFWATESFVEKS